MGKLNWNISPPRVAIMGNHAGGAFSMWKGLYRNGFKAHLLLSRSETGTAGLAIEGEEPPDTSLIVYYGGALPKNNSFASILLARLVNQLLMVPASFYLLRYDLIHSLSSSLCGSPVCFFLFCVLRLRPYLAFPTGSDLREAPFKKGLRAWMSRVYFKNARKVYLMNPDMIRVCPSLDIKKPTPFTMTIDTAKYSPMPCKKEIGTEDETLFFMPSHLDWGVTDNEPGRSSTKGNDRFIRAFAKCAGEGCKIRALLLDRGSDRLLAKQLVKELGLSDKVHFLPEMDKPTLTKYFRMADVIVDQFDLMSYGTITLEAMACAKPVLIAFDMDCARKCGYTEEPPFCNVHTEEEICRGIKEMLSPQKRNEMGAAARLWVQEMHGEPVVSAKLVAEYRETIGLDKKTRTA